MVLPKLLVGWSPSFPLNFKSIQWISSFSKSLRWLHLRFTAHPLYNITVIKALCHILFLEFSFHFTRRRLILFSGMLSPPVAAFPELQPLLALWIFSFTILFLVKDFQSSSNCPDPPSSLFSQDYFQGFNISRSFSVFLNAFTPSSWDAMLAWERETLSQIMVLDHPLLLSGLPPEYS